MVLIVLRKPKFEIVYMKAVHFEVKFNNVKMKLNLKGHHVFL